jgi:hypothetical protein
MKFFGEFFCINDIDIHQLNLRPFEIFNFFVEIY